MIAREISAPNMPSSEKSHNSITTAEKSVANVMIASNKASEPEAIKASLFSSSPLFFTYRPNTSFTAIATTMTMSVTVV